MSNRDESRAISRQELRTCARKMTSFEHGQMYVAVAHPPVEFDVIRLEGGPTESHSRLRMDALFRSAAMPCRRRDRKSAPTLTGCRRERS
jgi:hypothetical protein